MDERFRCGFMFAPSSMFQDTRKSILKASTTGVRASSLPSESFGGGGGGDGPPSPQQQQQTKNVTFLDDAVDDNGECVPMDISGE
jgi:hypothetical protein